MLSPTVFLRPISTVWDARNIDRRLPKPFAGYQPRPETIGSNPEIFWPTKPLEQKRGQP
jgi:hypothetical protein